MKPNERVNLNLSIKDAEWLIVIIEDYADIETLEREAFVEAKLLAIRIKRMIETRLEKNVLISETTKQPKVQTKQKKRGTSTKV